MEKAKTSGKGNQVIRKTDYYSAKRVKTAHILRENPGMSIAKAMIKAGYSPNTAKGGKGAKLITESSIYARVKEENEKKIEKIIQASYKRALETAHKATYRDAVTGIDTLTKTKRLIQGKTTENVGVNIASVLHQLENGEI